MMLQMEDPMLARPAGHPSIDYVRADGWTAHAKAQGVMPAGGGVQLRLRTEGGPIQCDWAGRA